MPIRSLMARRAAVVGALVAMVATGAPVGAAPPDPLRLTHGVASGDVTEGGAVLWARVDRPAVVHFEVSTDPGFRRHDAAVTVPADPDADLTAHAAVGDLQPGTEYVYRVWATGSKGGLSAARVGSFRTAPAPDAAEPVRLVWGGDVGGQSYCRNAAWGGYAIFAEMAELSPDLFVANGDMIYADGACPADGPGDWENIPGDFPSIAAVDWTDPDAVAGVFEGHWRYNREDPFLQDFLARVPMVAQWDDHEVINDFGAPWTYLNSATADRAGYPNIVEAGRETFFAYSPMAHNPADPNRIYRSFDWGKNLELFVVDARSYRSRNDVADTPENAKTLLGTAQIDWLVDGVTESDAVWKVVSSDVPISIPTGSVAFGRDAWANGAEPGGFERELWGLLSELDAADVENLVFITTDVHFAETMRYAVDADGDGDSLVFHELVSGPLNAVRGFPRTLDDTFSPEVLYAEGGIFNFGMLEIVAGSDGLPRLRADIRDETGAVRPGSSIELAPAS